jgi:glutamate synthase (NADPH) large chain
MNGLEERLDEMIYEINKAVDDGCNIIILSDRNVSENLAPIPSLLACSYVHHTVKKHKRRSSFGIVIESAEPREAHHFALLFGYGASAINPYLVNEIIYDLVNTNEIEVQNAEEAVQNFNTAIGKGIIKIMNKIGISTLHSYEGPKFLRSLD